MCQKNINRNDISVHLQEELRFCVRRALSRQASISDKNAGVDCIKEIRNNLRKPIQKPIVVRYATLKWLLIQSCKFEGGVSMVDEIHNWDDDGKNTFEFDFRDKPFYVTITNYDNINKYEICLAYTEGWNTVSVNYNDVPEFHKQLTDVESTFILELYHKFQRIFYDKVFRKVLFGVPIENNESREGELHLPS